MLLQKNIHSIENCNAANENLYINGKQLYTAVGNYYSDLINYQGELRKITAGSGNAVTLTQGLSKDNGIVNILNKNYHFIKPGPEILNDNPPKFEAYPAPERQTKEPKESPKNSGWGK